MKKLSMESRARLFDWCKKHEGDPRTFSGLAVIASADLGIPMSAETMRNHWCAVNGPRTIRKQKPLPEWALDLIKRVSDLEERFPEFVSEDECPLSTEIISKPNSSAETPV